MSTKKLVNRKSKKAITTCKKAKIQRKVRQNAKKIKREAKRMRALGLRRKSGARALRVPNLNPEKKGLLESFLRRRADDEQTLQNLQKPIAVPDLARAADAPSEAAGDAPAMYKESRAHFRSLNYVLENADVIVEVLDARYPDACRCRALERRIVARHAEKRLILLLNKIDLVPPEVALIWQRTLSAEYPTVLFRANRQEQRGALSGNTLFANSIEQRPELVDSLLRSAKSIGAEKLLELVKNYARRGDGKQTSITVGVVGFPNVGKSSVINSLARRKATRVSNVPGFTRDIQRVEIDGKVDVIDCPGVIPNAEDEIALLLRNSIRAHQVNDVEAAVEEIVRRAGKAQLAALYGDAFDDAQALLARVAESRGKVKKGGIPDLEAAARIVIHDWCEGKIEYYTLPKQAPNPQMTIE